MRAIAIRICGLALAGVSLYLLAPKLLDVFSSWPELSAINPWWIAPALVFEACSYISLWTLQRIALLAAVGKWGFDYLALICVLAALDTRPEPGLVLLAYAAASLLLSLIHI